MSPIREEPSSKFFVVGTGPKGRVIISRRVKAAYDELQSSHEERRVRAKVQLGRYMNQFCNEASYLNESQFKHENTFRIGGSTVSVFAFKPWQWRLYGIIEDIGRVKSFVGLKVDAEKKQDKADRQMLKRTAEEYLEIRADAHDIKRWVV